MLPNFFPLAQGTACQFPSVPTPCKTDCQDPPLFRMHNPRPGTLRQNSTAPPLSRAGGDETPEMNSRPAGLRRSLSCRAQRPRGALRFGRGARRRRGALRRPQGRLARALSSLVEDRPRCCVLTSRATWPTTAPRSRRRCSSSPAPEPRKIELASRSLNSPSLPLGPKTRCFHTPPLPLISPDMMVGDFRL